ncbi:MAG: molybdopterin biosynthesis protein [Bacteroidetes bacterium GWF2_38_335]|nr:MAG: molybdopterin biosynthesis protein [Bacteroidetes bacterium GWF2_38_335]OFY80544.1 MAG: molybdopterin biosynthesis protein [Bacteroidetes bacterium RIFOXYA12_FULL_38_20]HBS85841.1 molybdopterin biosynthesis protein [Bacteroidales bacterium]
MLTEKEKNRYHRHLILPEFGEKAQLKLKAAKVLVVGAGGLGSPVLTYLAAAGVGQIGIIEKDVVDETNLQRQILYSTSDIGKPKSLMAKERLSSLNPNVQISLYNDWLTEENAEKIISDYDLVVDCPDNLQTRFLVSDATSKLGKPHIFGAIRQYDGQVAVFNMKPGNTYRKLFVDIPEDFSTEESEKGVLGVLPGIIGCIMANETIKVITGTGITLSGKLLMIDIKNNHFQEITIA